MEPLVCRAASIKYLEFHIPATLLVVFVLVHEGASVVDRSCTCYCSYHVVRGREVLRGPTILFEGVPYSPLFLHKFFFAGPLGYSFFFLRALTLGGLLLWETSIRDGFLANFSCLGVPCFRFSSYLLSSNSIDFIGSHSTPLSSSSPR